MWWRSGSPGTRWRRLRRLALVLLLLLVAGKIVLRLVPRAPLQRGYPSSVAVYDEHHHLLRLTLSADEKYRLWTPLAQISPLLVQATLLYEDRHFYHHVAVNPWALLRAAAMTYGSGERRIGGSTITMQLSRRLYNIQSRTLSGKARQIARAVVLELLYSKDEILEAYLNLVPYGGNIEGVAAASLIYFGKPASKLLLPEALAMAVIPQSPVRRAPTGSGPAGGAAPELANRAERSAEGPAREQARLRLFQRWVKDHPAASRDEALMRLPLRMGDRPSRDDRAAGGPGSMPYLAPHFVDSVIRAQQGAPAGSGETQLYTTLDLSLQRLLERHARAYVARQGRVGIRNAAAMLVDYRSMEVKAALGSVDFWNDEIAGQVNGTEAKRSPGSALKPFIYALGIEQGVIHPLTMLKDAPLSFAAYSPENFDGRFMGPVSAKEALIRSRNIPALSVAARLGQPSFYDFLKTAGISRLRSEAHYGLSLVLGGAEVTMEELVTLYAMLGNRGLLRPLRTLRHEGDQGSPGVRVLSEEASFLVIDMLRDNPRPEGGVTADWHWQKDPLPVAWKTGTSYAFRDAWAVGLFGPYVLAVWIGNFSGEGNPAFVGVTAAAPLFFEIVDSVKALHGALVEPAFPLPRNLSRVQVCALSGQLPQAACPHRRTAWFIPGRSPIDVCQIHRQVLVDNRTGAQACALPGGLGQGPQGALVPAPWGGPPSAPARGAAHTEVFEFWPSDLARLFQLAGLPRRPPPPAGPGCSLEQDAQRGSPPRISSPLRGVTYTLRAGAASEEAISLLAVTDADVREVFWFVGEGFVGRAQSGTPLLWPPRPGRFTVRAVDDRGRADTRELVVEMAP